MGSCYSKNSVGAGSSSQCKKPKQKLKDSHKKAEPSPNELIDESLLKESGEHLNDMIIVMADTTMRSRSTTPEIISGHLIETHLEPCVVPSDSGIESLDNVQIEAAESTQSKQDRSELSNNLEFSNHEPCHINNSLGIYSLNTYSADGSCLNKEKQVERLLVNSQCQTHETYQNKSSHAMHYPNNDSHIISSDRTFNSCGTMTNSSHSNIEDFKFSSGNENSTSKNKSSKTSTENLNTVHASLSTLERSEHFVPTLSSKDNNGKAPLAQFDSIEASLNDSLLQVSQMRQSLLSEILDITQSLCKCDFYSSEYCTRDHGINADVKETNELKSEIGVTRQSDKSSEHFDLINKSKSCKSEALLDSAVSFPQKFSTPCKKGSSMPKIVSFAAHKEMSNDVFKVPLNVATDKSLLTFRTTHHCLEADKFESSSGGYCSKTASELTLSKRVKDSHHRSASLGSVRALVSDSYSDVADCDTEDDMASVDLDKISRVTSISYGSIRQLMESTEDLVSRSYTAQPVNINGMEYIVIPAETYRQMQADLSVLKRQLQCLSSLIQETADLA